MTLILGAMDGEIAEITRHMDVDQQSDWNGFPIHTGRISGKDVVVCRTGVGKTLSSMLCQHLIGQSRPDRVIFTGVAGALSPELSIKDTIIASDCMQHDMDATPLGFQRGEVPYSPFRILDCDPELVALAQKVTPLAGTSHVGRVLTGDQFIARADTRQELYRELKGDCVEMEGASVGLVAASNGIPFLLIRTISDQADGSAVDFMSVIGFAAKNSWHYLCQILASVDC